MIKTCSGAAYQVSSSSSCLQASIPARSVNVTIKIDNEVHALIAADSNLTSDLFKFVMGIATEQVKNLEAKTSERG